MNISTFIRTARRTNRHPSALFEFLHLKQEDIQLMIFKLRHKPPQQRIFQIHLLR